MIAVAVKPTASLNLSARMLAVGLLTLLMSTVPACKKDSVQTESIAFEAESIGSHECAACGMIVRDQPAPRGQLIHRDGTRHYFCSIADMITYIPAPSPHGRPVAVFVEVMAADADPSNMDTSPRHWSLAEDVSYVVGGIERQVMGETIMTYVDDQTAEEAAVQLNSQAVRWLQLVEMLE